MQGGGGDEDHFGMVWWVDAVAGARYSKQRLNSCSAVYISIKVKVHIFPKVM